ncbi:MAG: 16S rRNA (guanine(966)-N(2))-methyltransferase RsmD [Rhodospirillales bacterium]|nr:16S rRNA (guanine(966)-N(2))-methyltransferase RsmD [Rhodospirillales bacterium]
MRVVGGKHRGRKLAAPADERIRPTSDRARESLFNILAHGRFAPGGISAVQDARVLDAFCGTGALGLEALSRGAAHAVFIDSDKAALDLVRANIVALGETGHALVRPADAVRPGKLPAGAPGPCTVAFLDPPYGSGLAGQALAALAENGWLADGAVCVVETAAQEALALPPRFAAIDERRYGKAKLTFLRYAPAG